MINHLELMLNQAIQFFQNGNLESAERLLIRILKSNTKNLPALHILGLIKASQGKHKEASDFLKRATRLNPGDPSLHYNLAKALSESGLNLDALAHHKKAIELDPRNPDALLNYAKTLSRLARSEEALVLLDEALNIAPNYAEVHLNRGATLKDLRRYDEAVKAADLALSLIPNYAEAWCNRGVAYKELGSYEESLSSYDKAIEIKPGYAEAWSNRGILLSLMKQFPLAAESYGEAYRLSPNTLGSLGKMLHEKMMCCDWSNFELIKNEIVIGLRNGYDIVEPFGYQGVSDSEELLKICAELYSNHYYTSPPSLMFNNKHPKNEKIKIGYVCGEFRQQATSILMSAVYEMHDKDLFEIFAFDSGWDDGSQIRHRINTSFNKIIDISKLNDFDAAKIINEMHIDILINLNGYFGKARQNIFSLKPASIQINYLGFPGTIGASYIDYLIADQVVIPESSRALYTEKIVYLPNCYQANDSMRAISKKTFHRKDFGIPENVFVFCCFNNSYKITPETFDSWSRILTQVPNSVLWLIDDNLFAKNNLIHEAQKRGLSASRLIFSERIDLADHLARHRLADLFLDSLPYNAHTTASDALWAGLPLLTMQGTTFPGRVAASLLKAIGLSDLITNNRLDYENLAIELALNQKKLSSIKERLSANMMTTSLFNSKQFTRNLETAYKQIYQLHLKNKIPQHLNITG